MKQLDPKSVWLFFLQGMIPLTIFFVLFGTIFSTIILVLLGLGLRYVLIAIGVYLVCTVLIFIWSKLTYHFYRYDLVENGFRKESGVFTKKYTTIPYERIQNVDINRRLIARLLGLSDLQIQTAGASATFGRHGRGMYAEGRLPGLSKEVAETLRDELIERSKTNRV